MRRWNWNWWSFSTYALLNAGSINVLLFVFVVCEKCTYDEVQMRIKYAAVQMAWSLLFHHVIFFHFIFRFSLSFRPFGFLFRCAPGLMWALSDVSVCAFAIRWALPLQFVTKYEFVDCILNNNDVLTTEWRKVWMNYAGIFVPFSLSYAISLSLVTSAASRRETATRRCNSNCYSLVQFCFCVWHVTNATTVNRLITHVPVTKKRKTQKHI